MLRETKRKKDEQVMYTFYKQHIQYKDYTLIGHVVRSSIVFVSGGVGNEIVGDSCSGEEEVVCGGVDGGGSGCITV
jgi:hypothetical protein